MKRLIMILMVALFATVPLKTAAQTPITVTATSGDKVKLQPIKTGSYEIEYVLADGNTPIKAYGILYVDNQAGVGLKVGMSLILLPDKKKMFVTSMNTIQSWKVDGNKYVTYDKDARTGKEEVGYGSIWAYSKQYQALKIKTPSQNAIVLYDPKSYKKIDDVKVMEKIFEIEDKPGAIYLNPLE